MGKDLRSAFIYQCATELTDAIYSLTREEAFLRDYQIRSSSMSILSNIAEGFERCSKTGFVQFLFQAKCSAGEICGWSKLNQASCFMLERLMLR